MTNDSLWLSRVGYVLGSERHDVLQCADHLLTDPVELVGAGFAHHHAAAPDETALDLAHRVVKEYGGDDLDPQALIWSSAIPETQNSGSAAQAVESRDVKHLMDYPASRLQADLGWEHAAVMGLTQQACTGVLGAWRLGAALLAFEREWDEVVCVNADRFPPGSLYEQTFNAISDAATMTRISREPEERSYRLLAVHQLTNGSMSAAGDAETAGMFFPWMHRAVTETIAKAGLTPGDLSWIVPQNTHKLTWSVLLGLLKITDLPVYDDTRPELGHMISGDNVANLSELERSGQLREGQKLLLTAAGYGANWQCAIVEVGPR